MCTISCVRTNANRIANGKREAREDRRITSSYVRFILINGLHCERNALYRRRDFVRCAATFLRSSSSPPTELADACYAHLPTAIISMSSLWECFQRRRRQRQRRVLFFTLDILLMYADASNSVNIRQRSAQFGNPIQIH